MYWPLSDRHKSVHLWVKKHLFKWPLAIKRFLFRVVNPDKKKSKKLEIKSNQTMAPYNTL